MIPGPWTISEEDAKARELKAAAQLADDIRACIVDGMSGDTKRMRLAARGYSGEEIRRLLPVVKQHYGEQG